MWSPGCSMVKSAAACAARPLANATAPAPPSRLADALLERRRRRVHDARVGVAVLLQVEVGRRRLRVLEDVAGRLEDRHGARAGVRVGPLAGVDGARVEAEGAGLQLFVSHALHTHSSRNAAMSGVWRASSSRNESWP